MSTERAVKLKKPSEPPSPRECGPRSRSTPPPGGRATVMPAPVEHPKMNTAMWGALKKHIMLQREKKKQEQEADAATERARGERELKRRQVAMKLEEIRDQLQQAQKKLLMLKEEKHQLFAQLRKVLQEEDARKRPLQKKADEMAALSHPYHQQQPHNAAMQQHSAAASSQHLRIQQMNQAHATYQLPQPIPQQPGILHRALLNPQLTPYPRPPWPQATTSSYSQQARPPQWGFWPQQPYAYTAQFPDSTAYGAPMLMPAYAPGYGPFYCAGTEVRGGLGSSYDAGPR
ncbi:hepatocyte growth factor-regulated tyrosine kinase substrate-like [Dermacentor albipictus]|uniref:hepatocyte growth factor-regulated tyrosine kinase substrate-like n=1 Tax=Dermacentor albipictus TaxID=60249 RepID=UPI0031FC4CD1